MCEVLSGTVQTLEIPSSLVKAKHGFSLDFGSSVMKIVYATEAGDKVRLHFVSYPRERMDEAFQHIKDKVGDYLEEGQEVKMTGIGCNQYENELRSTLGIKSVNIIEMNCFVKAFMFLMSNCSLEELMHPKDQHVEDHAKKEVGIWNAGWKKAAIGMMKHLWVWHNEPQAEPLTDHKLQFPVVLAMCGSAVAIMKIVNKEGEFEFCDYSPISGRTLLAAGSILTGAKSFEELMDLAAKGSSSKMDVLGTHSVNPDADDDYSEFAVDMEFFMWGHATGKDLESFTREDRAAAVVSLMTESLASYTHQWAHMCNAKHVFFCGGVHTNSSVVREKLNKYFTVRARRYPLGTHQVQPHFIKQGAYLGALGALLENLGTNN